MQHFSHLLLMMNGMLQLLHFQMARLLDSQKSLMKCSNIWTQDHSTFSKISSQIVLHRDIWGECWEKVPNRKKKFFQLTNVLNQITKFTSFLLKNIFLKKISIWYFFPALIPYNKFYASAQFEAPIINVNKG